MKGLAITSVSYGTPMKLTDLTSCSPLLMLSFGGEIGIGAGTASLHPGLEKEGVIK